MVVTYNTGDKEHRLVEDRQKFNDEEYHVVRFYRNRNNATLFVDDYPGLVSDNTGINTDGNSFEFIRNIDVGDKCGWRNTSLLETGDQDQSCLKLLGSPQKNCSLF